MAVVVLDELVEHDLKVTPVDDEHPIEALPTDSADETLGEGSGRRGSDRCADDPDSLGMEGAVRTATPAVRSRLRPRIGRSLALRRPWSAPTSAGSPRVPIAVAKNRVAAFVPRILEMHASMTCPDWSGGTATLHPDSLARAELWHDGDESAAPSSFNEIVPAGPHRSHARSFQFWSEPMAHPTVAVSGGALPR
jgi:hypothetical protein